jgi:signal peptidase
VSEHRAHRRARHGTLSRAICWTLICAVACVVAAAVLVPRLGGGTPYVILTGSMRPSLPPGTLVVTRPVGTVLPGIGSVVTYQRASGEPTVVTHRVVAQGVSATGEQVVRTQGDANPVPDPGWVRPVQLRGERWYDVPYLGYVTTVLSSSARGALQTLMIAVLLLYAAYMITTGLRDRTSVRAVP